MRNCRICQEPIPESARFCPFCGATVIEETITCPSCGEENDLLAASCSKCGFGLIPGKEQPPKTEQAKASTNHIFDTSHAESLEQEVADRFSIAFERRLAEEVKPARHNPYIDRFYQSDFKNSVEFRIQQLAEQIQSTALGNEAVGQLTGPVFEELLDYFFIRYCQDLNETAYPEAILRWQGLPAQKINLAEMLPDYLGFEHENETVFTNFVTMPAQKLKNAAQEFLFPKKGETIFFICDLSMLGNCKDGFAMTRDCIYWKMPLEKKQRVYYRNLEEVKRQEDWITINGIFFNANKSLNLKLLRLLKKLRQLYGKG